MLRMQEANFRAASTPLFMCGMSATRGLQPLIPPSNILSHRKVPFQKNASPPLLHGKILKKGPDLMIYIN